MKILVTGATGFVGTWLCERLNQLEHDLHILVRNPNELDEDLQVLKPTLHLGDITILESVEKAVQGMDFVFHLAGLIAYSEKMRALMEKVNVLGTTNIVSACKKAGVRRLVNMSSVTAVGAGLHKDQILNEQFEFNLEHLHLSYFDTKRKAEQIALEIARRGQLDVICINPSTIYGARDAKKPSRKAQLKVARGELPFYTSGGVSVVAVEDVIHCLVACMDKGKSGERYIVSGENLTIKQVFDLIAQAAGVSGPKVHLPNWAVFTLGRFGQIQEALGMNPFLAYENALVSTMYHWFDSQKAQASFGFKPKPAREAIAASVLWSKKAGLI